MMNSKFFNTLVNFYRQLDRDEFTLMDVLAKDAVEKKAANDDHNAPMGDHTPRRVA